MHIAALTVNPPLILAPLAGYTDLPFRLLCREYGAGLTVTEMISCHGIRFRQQNTLTMLQTIEAERPVSIQLFGAEPEVMAEAAAFVSDLPFDCIDINMGCPVKKVTKKGAGCALMRDLPRAGAIIRAVVAASRLPVTVKFRSGWTHQTVNAVAFAQLAEANGAAAVTIHARTASDGFSGRVDWRHIAEVKEALGIPVIGNGDLLSREEGLRMIAETGCDGVMIGRAALGAPWIFSAEAPADPPLAYRLHALRRHLELIRLHLPSSSPARIRNHISRYFKGMPGGSALRAEIFKQSSLAELESLLASLD